MKQRTLSIIKPDATKRNLIGKINSKFENAGLSIIAQKKIHITKKQAEGFYFVHRERPFYDELCNFMCSHPIIVQVLEGEDAINKNREIMGATNPKEAESNTLRKLYGISIDKNSVHGSDSKDNAKKEINFFFKS